jgi:hypothetical protein
MEEFLTPKQAAKVLRKKEQTLAEWRCTKRYLLPYLKIGGRILYARSAILAFIEQSQHNAIEVR